MLEIDRHDIPEFINQFEDHTSPIRIAYEQGRVKTEFEIMEKLATKVEEAREGSDEAAKALNNMRKYQGINEHLNEIFGLWATWRV